MFKTITFYVISHVRELFLLLVPVLLIRSIKKIIRAKQKHDKTRKEKELAILVRRNEALDQEILNPDRKPGDVIEKKYPYQVTYYSHSGEIGRKSTQKKKATLSPRKTEKRLEKQKIHRKEERVLPGGTMLKLTEYSRLSSKAYTYRIGEVVRVGSQYGKTGILEGDNADSTLFFEIYSDKGAYYLRSDENANVVLQRGSSEKCDIFVGERLKAGDRIRVTGKIYEIGFI